MTHSIFSAVLIGCTLFSATVQAEDLRAPFDTAPVATPKKAKSYDCPDVPDPVVSLATKSSYNQKDPTRSQYDAEARKNYLKAIAPVWEYNGGIVKIANHYRTGKYESEAVVECLQDWLGDWAEDNALSDLATDTAQLHMGQTIATIAFAFMQAANDPSFDADKKEEIASWLNDRTTSMIAFVNARPDKITSSNNIRYWNGLGAAAAGVALNNRTLFDWGIESARIGIRQIALDGTLPEELSRASRARHYHFFGGTPLFATAELAAANGIDLYSENNGALQRLAKLLIQSVNDPSIFEKRTGTTQVKEGNSMLPQENVMAWLYLYNRHFPSTQAETILKQYPSLGSSPLGGDVRLLYSGR